MGVTDSSGLSVVLSIHGATPHDVHLFKSPAFSWLESFNERMLSKSLKSLVTL